MKSCWPGTPHLVFLEQLSTRRIWILPFKTINRPVCVFVCAQVCCHIVHGLSRHARVFWHGSEQLITGRDQRDTLCIPTPLLLFLLMLTVMGAHTHTHTQYVYQSMCFRLWVHSAWPVHWQCKNGARNYSKNIFLKISHQEIQKSNKNVLYPWLNKPTFLNMAQWEL